MWTRSYSKIYSGIKKEDIWRAWVDVNNWPLWHDDLEYCTLEGPFVVGGFFMLKPRGMSAVKIILTDIQEGRQFTDCTTFFGAKMYDTHIVEELTDGQLRLTNTLVVTGWLQWLWVKLVAQNIADTVPAELEALVSLVRKRDE